MTRDDARHSGNKAVKGRRRIALAIVVAVVGTANFILEQVTAHPLVAFIASLVLAMTAVPAVGFHPAVRRLLDVMIDNFPTGTMTKWRWIAIAVVLVLAAVTGVLLIRGPLANEKPPIADGCEHPVELRVFTSADGLIPTRELADRYELATAEGNDGCPRVHPFVYAADTWDAAISALAHNWLAANPRKEPLAVIGPRPDLWLPDSQLDVQAVQQLATREDQPQAIRASVSIASSPLVLVSRHPAPVTRTTWRAALAAIVSEAGGQVLVSDPETSSAGLLTAEAYLRGPDGHLVALPEARKRQRAGATTGAVDGGSASLLCRWALPAAPHDSQAAVVSEQSWQQFQLGRAPGCPQQKLRGDLGQPLQDLTGAPVLDHPLVEFTWSNAAQTQAVHDFRVWLSGSGGVAALAAVGLERPREDCANDQKPTLCVPDKPGEVLDLYRQAQEPGRVLLALDISGSMAQPAGTSSRLVVASQAITQALGQMGGQDQFGIWAFSGALSSGRRPLVAIAQGDQAHRKEVGDALRNVQPGGGTPLYDTVAAGLRAVSDGATATQPQALVVLTDGEDTSSRLNLKQVMTAAADMGATHNVRLFVVAMGDAHCDELTPLTDAGHGECYPVTGDQLPEVMSQLFDVLWRGL